MKKILIIIAIVLLFIACENEEQNTCFCENGKWFIPLSEQRDSNNPELGLPYIVLPTEYNCETLEPITNKPTENAVFLGCE
jgi:hypothetical protein